MAIPEVRSKHEIDALLCKWFKVGQTVPTTSDPSTSKERVIVGFEKKFIQRGGRDHQNAGIYLDFLRLITDDNETHYASRFPLPSSHERSSDEMLRLFRSLNMRIGDLPETPFEVGDIVTFPIETVLQNFIFTGVVKSIQFDLLGNNHRYNVEGDSKKQDSPSMRVAYSNNTNMWATINYNKITLVSRGNVWKLMHHEPLEFPTVHDEACFYKALGMSKKVTVLNGKNADHERFSFLEAHDALTRGDAHQMICSRHKDTLDRNNCFLVIKYTVPHSDFCDRMRKDMLAKFAA